MSEPNLFSPVTVGALSLPNRIVMAPMTRNRAGEGDAPVAMNVEYYVQRASAGLIITEASQISPQGLGYPHTPGIYSPAQITGWRQITDAVHAKGGHIVLQLWHVGRISHPSLQPDGGLPVAPSAIKPTGETVTETGMQAFVTPRALETSEIPGIVQDYAQATRNAKEAGFDGVEIHAANGYLIDQFLRDGTNQRTDQYGGSVENRARLLFEVTEAVVAAWSADRVGVRLSPTGSFNDMHDSDPVATFSHAVQGLKPYGLAYLHVIEPIVQDQTTAAPQPISPVLREAFGGAFIANGGYTRETGDAAIASGAADLVAFGVPFIANPDLPARFARSAPLAQADQATFYGGTEKGYIDYPALS